MISADPDFPNRRLLLRQLEVLGTISKVAELRSLTRPAVSRQLARLEKDIGSALIERSVRGVELTSVGKSLVARCSELFRLAERIEFDLVTSKRQIAGEVRVSAIGSVGSGLVPKAYTILAERHPDVELLFEEVESHDGQRAAAARQVDLAVVDDSIRNAALAGSFQPLPIGLDSLMVVLCARHPLAKRPHLALADLANERWCINRASLGYCELLLSACRMSRFEPRIQAVAGVAWQRRTDSRRQRHRRPAVTLARQRAARSGLRCPAALAVPDAQDRRSHSSWRTQDALLSTQSSSRFARQ